MYLPATSQNFVSHVFLNLHERYIHRSGFSLLVAQPQNYLVIEILDVKNSGLIKTLADDHTYHKPFLLFCFVKNLNFFKTCSKGYVLHISTAEQFNFARLRSVELLTLRNTWRILTLEGLDRLAHAISNKMLDLSPTVHEFFHNDTFDANDRMRRHAVCYTNFIGLLFFFIFCFCCTKFVVVYSNVYSSQYAMRGTKHLSFVLYSFRPTTQVPHITS